MRIAGISRVRKAASTTVTGSGNTDHVERSGE
jgi:hypothetical protein